MPDPSSTIVHGPQACGKTRNAKALAAHFGCTSIVDDWNGRSPLPANALALTHELPEGATGSLVLGFDEACRLAGINAS